METTSNKDGAAAEPVAWRIGRHYRLHVYEGDRPVATFHSEADASRAVAAVNAPAAPRKRPSEKEIAREVFIANNVSHDGTPQLAAEDWRIGLFPRDREMAFNAARRILALLTPADRGETHKIIEAADCIGVRGATWALTIEWPDGTETIEHVSDHGARALGYVSDDGEG